MGLAVMRALASHQITVKPSQAYPLRTINEFIIQKLNPLLVVDFRLISAFLGGVYMRKLAPARVSYRHDFLISYRVYMMTGLFHI